jgi:betaine-aldehyde dehydrogenase
MTTEIQALIQSLSGKNYIGGAYVASQGDRANIIDPATEEVIGQYPLSTDAEVELAIANANAAQKKWWALSSVDRANALHDVSRKMKLNAHRVGEVLTREMGKPYREAIWEGGAAASSIDYYAELARHDNGRVAGPAIAGQLQMTVKEPLGVVVSIVPFNFPVLLFVWQAAASLAAGNAIIVKPSDLTPFSLLILMEAFDHLPPGLVQVLCGGASVGKLLVSHRDTHAIAFTGSVPAAQSVAQAAALRFKPVLIEASGNDPFIVMPSAPVETAAKGAAFAAFLNCGQVCTSAERLYVHADIYDQFLAALKKEVLALRVGNGLECVDIGPMASKSERDRFEKMIARAVEQGAKIITGGKRPTHLKRGWYVEPTILEVSHDMDIMHSESFGPVAPICKIHSLDEAIRCANDSEFGLGANIYTHNLAEAMRAVNEIESGIVWVNTPLNDNDTLPFGGRKMTGTGRELGGEGLEQFRRSKMVMIAPEALSDPEWFPYPDAEAFCNFR